MLQDDALLQDFALRRRLNEYMIPNNLERSVAFQQNPFQQNPFQQNPYQQNKNQFIPPHFKQDVYKEFKKLLDENYNNMTSAKLFLDLKSELDDWIEEEKNRVSGPNMLEPSIVAKEFFDSQTGPDMDQEYEEDEENNAAATAIGVPALVSGATSSSAAAIGVPALVSGTPSSAAAAGPALGAPPPPASSSPPPAVLPGLRSRLPGLRSRLPVPPGSPGSPIPSRRLLS